MLRNILVCGVLAMSAAACSALPSGVAVTLTDACAKVAKAEKVVDAVSADVSELKNPVDSAEAEIKNICADPDKFAKDAGAVAKVVKALVH